MSIRRPVLHPQLSIEQRRSYIVSTNTGAELLRDYGLNCPSSIKSIGVQISVDRNTYSPLLTFTSPAGSASNHSIPFSYNSTDEQVSQVVSEATSKFDSNIEEINAFANQIAKLFKLYKEKEAEKLDVEFTFDPSNKSWQITKNSMDFNNSSFRTSKRHQDLWDKRVGRVSPTEAEAIEYGIVYVPLPGDGNVGTIGMSKDSLNTLHLRLSRANETNRKLRRPRNEHHRLPRHPWRSPV